MIDRSVWPRVEVMAITSICRVLKLRPYLKSCTVIYDNPAWRLSDVKDENIQNRAASTCQIFTNEIAVRPYARILNVVFTRGPIKKSKIDTLFIDLEDHSGWRIALGGWPMRPPPSSDSPAIVTPSVNKLYESHPLDL